mgnify:CR=1 FL=1
MDGAQLSRYAHFSWMQFSFSVTPAMRDVCWNLAGKAHSLNIVFHGHGRVRWLCRGQETPYEATPGSMHFLPADGELHTLVARATEPSFAHTLFLPQGHLESLADEDHIPARVEYHRLFIASDAVLHACMLRLSRSTLTRDDAMALGVEEAARRLVTRLVMLSGGGTPDWHDDVSTFTRRSLDHLVEHIDANLKTEPLLSEMGMRMGLSPSHFAKKFRQTTGVSLHRFVNRRRILASLELLKNQSVPLAHHALALGFSSQAHFTHLFSCLTGMTPAKYRKQFRRVIG